MKTTSRSLCVIVLLAVVMTATLYAGGDKYSPRLVGLGRAFTALSRGLDAVGTNPANLALDDRNATFTLNIAPIGFSIGSDLVNYKIYNDFFVGIPDPNDPNNRIGKPLNDQDKNEILGLFPDGIARTQLNLETAPVGFSLQIGSFGLAIVPSMKVASNIDLSEGYLKFLLNGLDGSDRVYSFNGTAVKASMVAEVNTSVAYVLPVSLPSVDEIAIGVGVKYLQGLGFTSTERYNASIGTVGQLYSGNGTSAYLPDSIKGNFDFVQLHAVMDPDDPQPVGSGMGFDFGVSAFIFDMVRVGASITDIGSIKWDKRTKAVVGRSSFAVDGLDQSKDTVISRSFKGETMDTTAFEFDLPTAIHLGAEMRVDEVFDVIPFRWTIAMDGHFGLNEVAGNTKTPQFSFGTELDPLAGWLPFRTGFLIGGRERFAWSAGFGIHLLNTFDLDFATQSIAIMTNPDGFRTGSFTMGMRLRF
jgi:hypothetical protein